MQKWSDSLAHFGIFGMKWGIRRFQNEDGSLTEEGKKRYGYSSSDVEDRFIKAINENNVGERIKSNTKKLQDQYLDVAEKLDAYHRKFKLSKKQKDEIWDSLHRDFGVGTDDEELYEVVLYEKAAEYIKKSYPERLKKDMKKLEMDDKAYWDELHSVTDKIIDEFKDSKIKDIADDKDTSAYDLLFASSTRRPSLVSKYFDNSFLAFLTRNFDDYYIDGDEYDKLFDRIADEFSIEEYNKRFG